MSNILKEPYEIVVWEEELIPAYSEYHEKADFTGDYLTEEEFQDKKYIENWVQSQENSNKYYYIYGDDSDAIDTSQGGTLPTESNANYGYEKVIMEHYEETNGIIIGAHDMDSPYAAAAPIFKENVNGSVELGFTLYYKVFDPDTGDYEINPLTSFLTNEAKVKLNYRGKWSDLIVKNRVEDSSNYSFTYTCKDIYINELNKNGFKVELDTELENNQGTNIELAETILDDTDWEVAPPIEMAPQGYTGPYSDILVETKIEPLYMGTLSKAVTIKKLHNYTPDEAADMTGQPDDYILPSGVDVLFFYSDIVENKRNPQILCRFKQETLGGIPRNIYCDPINSQNEYLVDVNEDIIVNAYNYQVVDDVLYLDSDDNFNIPNILEDYMEVYEYARGEKVIKSQKTGYDPDLDKFIYKFYKKNEDGTFNPNVEYYGYIKIDVLSSELSQNFLSNSDDFVNLDSGWVFEGIPAKTKKVKGVEQIAGYSGQLYNVNNEFTIEGTNASSVENVLILQLKNQANEEKYLDVNGEFYLYKEAGEDENGNPVAAQYVEVSSEAGKSIEADVRAAVYKFRKNAVDGYAEKTDEQLEKIIDDALKARRYSSRARYAINTGIAANRQTIESLTPGEEFLFAASIGRFKEGGENPIQAPNYRVPIDENDEGEYPEIKYGMNNPSAFYKFKNITNLEQFAETAGEISIDETDNKLEKNPLVYYLKNPQYKEAYDDAYNTYIKRKQDEYKEKYTNLLNNASDEGKQNWGSGGKKFREFFLSYLKNEKYFSHKGVSTQFATTIAIWLVNYNSYLNNTNDERSIYQKIYEILIDRPSNFDSNGKKYSNQYGYFSGLYPSMAYDCIDKAKDEQKKAVIKSKWDPMGYDDAQYPEFNTFTQDLDVFNRSFNEALFTEIYYRLQDTFTIQQKIAGQWQTIWNNNTIPYTEDESKINDNIEKVQEIVIGILEATYDTVCKNGNWYNSLNYAQEYELPSLLNKSGGSIYQQYLKQWQSGDNYEDTGRKDEDQKPIYENTNAEKEGMKAINEEEESTHVFDKPDSIDYVKLGNFILEKEEKFNAEYSINEIGGIKYNQDYSEELILWIQEYLSQNGGIKENDYYYYKSAYYYYVFVPIFMTNWRDAQKVGTYVYNDNVYELALETEDEQLNKKVKRNNIEYSIRKHPDSQQHVWYLCTVDEQTGNISYLEEQGNLVAYQVETIPGENKAADLEGDYIWTYNSETKKYEYQELKTYSGTAPYLAVKTRYNPYTNENQEEVGGYVYDKNTKQIRLFDVEKDSLNALFIPIKDKDGDYVFDVFQQQYRPFRDWRNDIKKDPLTLKNDDNNGVYGDLVYHPLKWFDGHIGDWTEDPTRYRMVRVREDPTNASKYKYLNEEKTIREVGRYKGEDYPYEVTYPAGYQLDNYIKDDDGKYIMLSPGTMRSGGAAEITDITLRDDNDFEGGKVFDVDGTKYGWLSSGKTFIDRVANFFIGLLSSKNETFREGGLRLDGENELTSIITYEGSNGGLLTMLKLDERENLAETMQNIDFLKEQKQKASQEPQPISNDDNTPEIAAVYTKYKWWYWKHWGKTRYSCIPKICVYHNENGVRVYKPFNKVQDAISADYKVMTHREANETGKVASFYLREPITTYRTALDSDYGARKYKMQWQDKKNKKYWVESTDGQNYLRHYRTGDGEIELFDGHFGKWIDCFQEIEVGANVEFDVNQTQENGLIEVIEKDEEGNDVRRYYLPDFYTLRDDIMVPYDARLLKQKERFTRIRVKRDPNKDYDSDHSERQYIYQDGIYLPFPIYQDQYGFNSVLNYDKLKISIIGNYSYDAANFAIKDIPDNRDIYLSFDLSQAPIGQRDFVISEDPFSEEVIKERWIYWKAAVNEGISLRKDPFQKLGMLFETNNTDSTNEGTVKYPFLGMQLFRHIPYEREVEEPTLIELLPTEENRYRINSILSELDYLEYYDTQKEEYVNVFSKWLDSGVCDHDEILTRTYNHFFSYLIGETRYGNITSYTNAATNEEIKEHEKKYLDSFFLGYDLVIGDDNKLYLQRKTETIPLFPGEVPNTKDLKRVNYYIYDPDSVNDIESVIYDYVGTRVEDRYIPIYDEYCQKIRSIKGKESNYFKLLQDCCDTFDCWIDPIIAHDNVSGKIQYVEKKVYIQTNNKQGEEPQIYVGEKQLKKKVEDRISILQTKYGVNAPSGGRISFNLETGKYEWIGEIEIEPKQQKDLDELNYLNELADNLTVQFIKVPDKKVRFKRYVGETNYNGFKYGVNLKHIKRTIDSNQISTRVIVKANKNENATDGFCSIQRASENTLKENFLLDFSYYIQKGILKNSDLINDLYTGVNTKLNYYTKLANLNKHNDEIATELSSLLISLDNIKAKYDTAMLAYDAAQEEIEKLAYTLTTSYDTYGQIIDVPWTPNKSQEYETKVQTSSPPITVTTTITSPDGMDTTQVVIDIPQTATEVEYPKYNDTLRSLLDQMDIHQTNFYKYEKIINDLKPKKLEIENRIQELYRLSDIIVEKKNELNRLFYHKYSRFIQEGSWVDESYIDDNLYYLDALSVLRTSSRPKITYDIGVADLSVAVEYEEDKLVLESKIGDRTYVEDIEFFGYQNDGITPYWEEVIVSEKIYHLEDPSQNQTKVKNYTTQFDDLFQRIAATSQTLQFNEGSFQRAAALVQSDGTLDSELFQNTLMSSDFIISTSTNEDVSWDNTGITIVNTLDKANVVKIVSRGILVSNDGGNNYKTAITGDGINADLLVAGRIDTGMLLVGDKDTPNFFWNKLGISAFKTINEGVDYSSFVRLDQFGIYGINNSETGDKYKLSFNDVFAPKSIKEIMDEPGAVFGLTWDGFFLNATDGKGRVLIGTNQDFRMSEYFEDEAIWRDKVIIGKLDSSDSSEDESYYGFRLKNNDNEIVMETSETGELYLKNKLRISRFTSNLKYSPYIYVENGKSITVQDTTYSTYYCRYWEDSTGTKQVTYYEPTRQTPILTEDTTIDWRNFVSNSKDRVTLGIVDIYKRNFSNNIQNYEKVDLHGEYNSAQFLTKVFSVKENGNSTFGQFNKTEVASLIEDGENLAIFDNGNLFAKNAWVQGQVYADSGTLENLDVIGTLNLGSKEDTISGTTTQGIIKSANNLWSISANGEANFRKIVTAVFEKGKIQTLAGAMLVRVGATVLAENRLGFCRYVIMDFEGTDIPKEFQEGCVVFVDTLDIQETTSKDFIKFYIRYPQDLQSHMDLFSDDFKKKLELYPDNAVLQLMYIKIDNRLQEFSLEDRILTSIGKTEVDQETQIRIDKILVNDIGRCQLVSIDDTFSSVDIVKEFSDKTLLSMEEAHKAYSYKVKHAYDADSKKEEVKQQLLSYGFEEDKIKDFLGQKIIVFSEFEDFEGAILYEKEILSLIETKGEINSSNYSTGIGLNASEEWLGGLPPESISLVDLSTFGEETYGTRVKLVLGKLDQNLLKDSNPLREALQNSYGLYCDNVVLEGSLCSFDESGNFAGITTRKSFLPISYDVININQGQEQIVTINTYATFFAGQGKDNLSFYVTQDGYLYANKGYFSGDIEASTIKTSVIEGNGSEQYALTIDGKYANKGLIFTDNIETPEEAYASFTSSKISFFEKIVGINSNNTVFSVVAGEVTAMELRGMGLFGMGQDLANYKFNIVEDTDTEEKVVLRYKNIPFAEVTDEGKFSLYGGGSLGTNTSTVDAYAQGQGENETIIIGSNFVINT